tara:strand:+ start:13232 stop:14374 length:1143 start_codon:yes stop_codon:yes gene_type:complete
MGKKNIAYPQKTYRHIQIGDRVYMGKDGDKNRTPNYIIDMFGGDYFNNKSVLDLGTAAGAILFNIQDKILKGTAVDIDDKKLNIGIDIAEKNNIDNINFILSKLEPFLSETKESYDCIFLLNILHHVQTPYKILDLVAELSNDMICIEAPLFGFYDAYERDIGKEVKFEGNLNLQDIISFLRERNYDLLIKQASDNQESFMGPERYVCIFQKRKIFFSDLESVRNLKRGIVIGPGASGKTRLLHDFYNIPVEYKGENIIKNKVFDGEGRSLKYGKNITTFTDDYPVIYIAPNYKSLSGFKPNINEWVRILRDKDATAIICYVKPYIHRERLLNRVKNKRGNSINQHLDNYPFSYQNLFYALEQENINYCVIDSSGGSDVI